MTTTSPPTRYRFTVKEFLRMGEVGIFAEDDRLELIEGEIIEMSPIGDPHAYCVDRFTYLLAPALHGRGIVRVQGPVSLDASSRPQPDIIVLRFRGDFYPPGAPARPEDVLLIIEVADSSLAYDRDVKLPLYSKAGVPEAWVASLPRREVIVGRDPGTEGYRDVSIVRGDDPIRLLAFPDVVITPNDILPPAEG